jgi:hypothetical protein
VKQKSYRHCCNSGDAGFKSLPRNRKCTFNFDSGYAIRKAESTGNRLNGARKLLAYVSLLGENMNSVKNSTQTPVLGSSS